MIIYIDIDNTICYYEENNTLDYNLAIPYKDRIEKINALFDKGHSIIYWTARGTTTGIYWFHDTYNQLTQWGCKFHELKLGKPVYDLFIDDKNINSETYFTTH